jgi:alkylglycerol monooxygenase
MSYIVYAIPVFLLLIGLELAITRAQERDYYSLADSISDLGCGVISQLFDVAMKTLLFAGYLYLYAHHRLIEIPARSVAAWVTCLLAYDFLYYWFHRKSHEVNAFWAAHVVHHQSEEYNLAVALRQGAFQSAFSWTFYLPLAVAGFPPVMFLTVSSIDTLYQFWIHTRAVGRLGPLEWVLSTPSNHRVHHGRNPKYIDRNHGGMLIVWDRLFGTYAPEEEEPVYGVTTPLRSWNPLWANFHYWTALAATARRAARPVDRLRLLIARPGWRPAELGGYQAAPEIDPATAAPFRGTASRPVQAYVLLQFVATLALGIAFLVRHEAWAPGSRAMVAGFVILGLVAGGGLLEGKRWAVPVEIARLVAAVPLVYMAAVARASWAPAVLTAIAVVVASALLLRITAPLAASPTHRAA